MRDEALWSRAADIDVFSEVDPNQKERIINALRKTRHSWASSAMASTMRRH